MSAKATICKTCGAPRDDGLPYAMCRACYDEYMRQSSAQKRRKMGVPEHKPGPNTNKPSEMKRAYARLGLSVGNVWRMVPR